MPRYLNEYLFKRGPPVGSKNAAESLYNNEASKILSDSSINILKNIYYSSTGKVRKIYQIEILNFIKIDSQSDKIIEKNNKDIRRYF
ncbi:hypothetical protein [Faecalimicrobium sp. JNUCC 81]